MFNSGNFFNFRKHYGIKEFMDMHRCMSNYLLNLFDFSFVNVATTAVMERSVAGLFDNIIYFMFYLLFLIMRYFTFPPAFLIHFCFSSYSCQLFHDIFRLKKLHNRRLRLKL